MAEFKELHCLLLSKDGTVCNRYLGDLEANSKTTIRCTCAGKHRGNNRIEFTQDENGLVSWRALPKHEQKIYADNNIRIGMVD